MTIQAYAKAEPPRKRYRYTQEQVKTMSVHTTIFDPPGWESKTCNCNFWQLQLLAIIGNYCYNIWQLLAIIGNNWQLLLFTVAIFFSVVELFFVTYTL